MPDALFSINGTDWLPTAVFTGLCDAAMQSSSGPALSFADDVEDEQAEAGSSSHSLAAATASRFKDEKKKGVSLGGAPGQQQQRHMLHSQHVDASSMVVIDEYEAVAGSHAAVVDQSTLSHVYFGVAQVRSSCSCSCLLIVYHHTQCLDGALCFVRSSYL